MWETIYQALGEATGISITRPSLRSVGGGCIHETYVLREGVHAFFVKINSEKKKGMFETEERGLREIAKTNTIRVPLPYVCGVAGEKAFLAMEYIELASAGEEGPRRLGEQLAAMHRVTRDRFGWDCDNTIGETPQINRWEEDWSLFFREHRLRPQFAWAQEKGKIFPQTERLLDKLPDLLEGHFPEPSLVHGDLWGGNAGFDKEDNPVLYDPAVYYGDRETDIAFTEMFGGFGEEFYAAYDRAFPLDGGYSRRKLLYNLYHVLNHYNLFGGGYGSQVESLIERILHSHIS